jgi:hypothetical protein
MYRARECSDQFYNDAYRQSLGDERHPSALGQEGRHCENEIWPIIGPQIQKVMSRRGHTWQENALVPITRNGRKEEVYWTYGYSPIDHPVAPTGVGGVLVICTETTQTILGARRQEHERQQFAQLFEQSPSFMAKLHGPDHRFDLVNPVYLRLVEVTCHAAARKRTQGRRLDPAAWLDQRTAGVEVTACWLVQRAGHVALHHCSPATLWCALTPDTMWHRSTS